MRAYDILMGKLVSRHTNDGMFHSGLFDVGNGNNLCSFEIDDH